jgi:predicted transcriptional regulator
MEKSLLEMAAEIVKAQASVTRMSAEELDAVLRKTYESLKSLKDQEEGVAAEATAKAVAIEPKSSIQQSKVICLECGKQFKQLTKTHLASHGLTAKEYKKKYGFKANQALVAKSLSASRRKLAKKLGLGEKLAAARKKRGKK